jgi:uncharacterized protein DUF5670
MVGGTVNQAVVIDSESQGRSNSPEQSLERRSRKGERTMLWTIFVILLVLWLLGMVSSYTMGGFIHILLVIALVVVVINLINGRRAVL